MHKFESPLTIYLLQYKQAHQNTPSPLKYHARVVVLALMMKIYYKCQWFVKYCVKLFFHFSGDWKKKFVFKISNILHWSQAIFEKFTSTVLTELSWQMWFNWQHEKILFHCFEIRDFSIKRFYNLET